MSNAGVQQFNEAVAQMPALLGALCAAPKHRVADHQSVPNTPGIYLFSERDSPVYVGQSRKLRSRLKQHTGTTSKQNQASFAFNLAKREAQGAGVDIKRWRSILEADERFMPHFDKARADVAAMNVQFIELADPIARTLFEVYAALALDTVEFNSFETHWDIRGCGAARVHRAVGLADLEGARVAGQRSGVPVRDAERAGP